MARVLLLGATSAVATALALRFAKQGDQLFCVGRDARKMQNLRGLLGDALIGFELADFNCTGENEALIAGIVKQIGQIDSVIIAHGVLGEQLASEEDYLLVEQSYRDNCLSAISLVIPLVRALKKQGGGKLAVMGSVAGDRGRPRNFTYGSAKGALALYLEGIRSVLWGSGVELYTLKLGPVDSPMTVDHEKNFSFTSVDRVAELIERALLGSRYVVYVPGFWRFVMLAVRCMPEWLFQRIGFLSGR